MAKKKVKSDFDDLKKEINKYDFDKYDFDESDFETMEDEPKGENRGHFLFFAIVIVVFIACGISLYIWNKGETIVIDPNEDTSEFDVEPNDYIQPMTSELLAGKVDDGVNTVLALGNSMFADDGENNLLAAEIARVYNANVVNMSVEDSTLSRVNPLGDDSEEDDAGSLYDVVASLAETDLSNIDMMVIAYDLSDYIAHRNIYNPGDEDDVTTFCGALSASIKLVQEKYPYIRIVVLSTPACGKTIDDFYVDGTYIDLGNGTLNDYMGQQVAVCATRGVSFIDLYFGVINVDTRDEMLVNDYHLNEAGAKAVAERMLKLIPME